MKNNLLKYYIVLAFFFSSVMLFAQPGDNDSAGTMEETTNDTTGAPIDDYVLVLALVGSAFVFWKVKAFTQQGNTLQK